MIMTGKGIRAIKVKRQSDQSIYPRTQPIESRSAIMGTSPSAKISLTDSISLTVRVVSVPIGVLSYCLTFNRRILLKVSMRRSLTTDCPSKAVWYEKPNRIKVSTKMIPTCIKVIKTSIRGNWPTMYSLTVSCTSIGRTGVIIASKMANSTETQKG